MFMVSVLAVAIFMMFPAVMTASAQEYRPCADDFKQYCGDVTPGGGRLVQCYEQNKSKMSADCVGWAEGIKSNAAAVKDACAKELDARCTSEKGDPFRTLDCLQSNYIDLSMRCREMLNSFKGRYPKPVQ